MTETPASGNQEKSIMDNFIMTTGYFNKEGELKIYGREQFIKASAERFAGANIELIIKQKENLFSDGYRAYYFKFIVKEIQKAFKALGVLKSLHDLDYELRSMFLYYETYDPGTDQYEKHLHTLRKADTKVTRAMMREYCLNCVRFSIQKLDWSIPLIGEDFVKEDMTEWQRTVEYKNK